MTPNPDLEDDLDAACAVLSRAARQRLLAMPPRQRVLALLRQGHNESAGELLMFAYDLHAVLASFEGDEVPSRPALQDLGHGKDSCVILTHRRHSAESAHWAAVTPMGLCTKPL